jgi:hypothetical protein
VIAMSGLGALIVMVLVFMAMVGAVMLGTAFRRAPPPTDEAIPTARTVRGSTSPIELPRHRKVIVSIPQLLAGILLCSVGGFGLLAIYSLATWATAPF